VADKQRITRLVEREADSFGVIAAWRAGFDPLRGAKTECDRKLEVLLAKKRN
jgi:anti-sigma-K factor RskA